MRLHILLGRHQVQQIDYAYSELTVPEKTDTVLRDSVNKLSRYLP